MPWKEASVMSERVEFIKVAIQPGVNFSQLCQHFEISRKTGYKWVRRYRMYGAPGLADRSRQPKHMPRKTPEAVERDVLEIRDKHPAWGGRKIHTRLKNLGHDDVPSPSTITAILHRHGCIELEETLKHIPFQRFEMEQPNQLWQMDFKGYFHIAGQQCHPLTILDDHSRYLVGLKACQNQQRETVKGHLTSVFRQYGLPESFLVDNGPPWGSLEGRRYYTRLNAWLFRLGIKVIHSRPYHPQTMGKDERLHRTLKAEVLTQKQFDDFPICQRGFDAWQHVYNCERPHEALAMDVPVSRYRPSLREFPERLPTIEYLSEDQVRKVGQQGRISFRKCRFRVGRAFADFPVAIRPTLTDGEFEVYFCNQKIRTISFHQVQC
jgi:transposase InsO family protein